MLDEQKRNCIEAEHLGAGLAIDLLDCCLDELETVVDIFWGYYDVLKCVQ